MIINLLPLLSIIMVLCGPAFSGVYAAVLPDKTEQLGTVPTAQSTDWFTHFKNWEKMLENHQNIPLEDLRQVVTELEEQHAIYARKIQKLQTGYQKDVVTTQVPPVQWQALIPEKTQQDLYHIIVTMFDKLDQHLHALTRPHHFVFPPPRYLQEAMNRASSSRRSNQSSQQVAP